MYKLNIATGLRLVVAVLFLSLSLISGPSFAYPVNGDMGTDNVGPVEDFEGTRFEFDEDMTFDGILDDPMLISYPGDETLVTVSGVVRDSAGNPVPNVWVNVEPQFDFFDDDIRPLGDDGLRPKHEGDWSEGVGDDLRYKHEGEFVETEFADSEIGNAKQEPWPADDMIMPFIPRGDAETDENGAFSISVSQGYDYDLFVNIKRLSDTDAIGGFFEDSDGGSSSDPGADNTWSGTTTHDWAKRTLITVGEEGVSDISITLGKGSRIYGKALDSEGKPVADLWIDASGDFPGAWGGSSTDEEGNFSIVVAPGEGYRVSSWPWQGGFLGGFWQAGTDNGFTASGQDGSLTLRWEDATFVDASSDVEINIIFEAANTISGYVGDEDGAPVSDMWVSASSGNPYIDVIFYDDDDEEKYETEEFFAPEPEPFWFGANTDENGYYEIAVYPASDYRVSVSGSGIYREVFYQNATKWEDATPVDVSQSSVKAIDFVLDMGASISGTISGLKKDDTAYVDIWNDNGRFGGGNARVLGTGSDVSFKMRGLEEGDKYIVNVWAEGYMGGCLLKDGTLGSREDAELFSTGAEINITMDRGREISGTLSGLSQGDMVWIDTYSDTGWSKGGTEVVAEGDTADFTLSGLAAASDFRLSVHADGYVSGSYGGPGSVPVPWDKAVQISTVDGDATGISITMSTGNTISGVVKGLDRGALVRINASSDTGSYGGTEVVGTGSDVDYEIKCLSPADDFRVSADAKGYIGGFYSAEGLTDWENADMVDASNNAADINLELSKGKTISGTITGLEEGEWAWIEARREKDGGMIEPMPMMSMSANGADKAYERCEIGWWGENNWGGTSVVGTGSPVKYEISGLASADDFIVTFRPEKHAPETKTGVDTSTNPGIDFTVSEGMHISGTVIGVKPNDVVFINVWSEASGMGGYAEARTDADGKAIYEISGLGSASDYVVSTWALDINLFYNQKFFWEDADRVDVSNGDVANINFDFGIIEMYTLSGEIAGLSDDVMVWIDAWSENGRGGWGNAEVRGNGSFSIKLLPGDYKVGIYGDGYVRTIYDAASGKLIYDWEAAEAVELNGDRDLGTLTLSMGNTISGTVTDAEGKALPKVWVDIYAETGDMGGNAGTNRRGEYRISGLADGAYFITAWSDYGYYEGELTIGGSDLTHDITLDGEDFGNVSGEADDAEVVLLFDEEDNFVNAVETDDSGNYNFSNIAAGEYTVKVKKNGKDDYEVLTTVNVDDGTE